MIRKFLFEYGYCDAEVVLIVDTEKFTEESAKDLLEFFSWDYDDDEPVIDEYMQKLSIEIMRVGFIGNLNVFGVIDEFEDNEGFPRLDGTLGIWLTRIDNFEFLDSDLQCSKSIIDNQVLSMEIRSLENAKKNMI